MGASRPALQADRPALRGTGSRRRRREPTASPAATLPVVYPPIGIPSGPPLGPAAGLCDTCRFQREVRTTRGSCFSLCERSREDPHYPRYPRLPVSSCAGYARRAQESRAPTATEADGGREA